MRLAAVGFGLAAVGGWLGLIILFASSWTVGYLLSIPAFFVAWGTSLMILHWPEVQHERHVHLEQVERLKTLGWEHQQKRVNISQNVVIEHDAERIETPAQKTHKRAWTHWLIRCASESVRLNSISYSNSMDAFFNFDGDKWGIYVDLLARWGMSWPRQAGVETFLRPGKTPKLICDLLEGGELPPALPDGLPPELFPRQELESSTVSRPVKSVKSPKKKVDAGPLGAGA